MCFLALLFGKKMFFLLPNALGVCLLGPFFGKNWNPIFASLVPGRTKETGEYPEQTGATLPARCTGP